MADSIRAALERLVNAVEVYDATGMDVLGDAITAARAALAEERGEGLSNRIASIAKAVQECAFTWEPDARLVGNVCAEDIADLCSAVLARWRHQPARLRNCPTHGQQPPEAWGCPECVRELREELAAARLRQPTPPAEGEVAQLVAWLRENAEDERQMCESSNRASLNLERAAELLQQQHPTPVPVSERLPEPEEMDGSLVWCGSQAAGLPYWEWCLDDIRHPGSSGYTHWLPANTPALPTALPVPQGEVKVMVDPFTTGRHHLLRFVKWGPKSKLLDQVAEWGDGGWLPTRWVPQSPQVPVEVLKIAEAWMRGEVDQ